MNNWVTQIWAGLFPEDRSANREMYEPTWARIHQLVESPGLEVDVATPPVSGVGGMPDPDRALLVKGLSEVKEVRDAFASVGWSLDEGHPWCCTISLASDEGFPVQILLSFDRSPSGKVRGWAAATVEVSRREGSVTAREHELITAIFQLVEGPDRAARYRGAVEKDWPRPFIGVIEDHHIVVLDPPGIARHEPVEPPVRALTVGYSWGPVEDGQARHKVITEAVNNLCMVIRSLNVLAQNPLAYRQYMGKGVPSFQLGERLAELVLPSSIRGDQEDDEDADWEANDDLGLDQLVLLAEDAADKEDFWALLQLSQSAAITADNLGSSEAERQSLRVLELLTNLGTQLFERLRALTRPWERTDPRISEALQQQAFIAYVLYKSHFAHGREGKGRVWAVRSAHAGSVAAHLDLSSLALNDKDWAKALDWAQRAAALPPLPFEEDEGARVHQQLGAAYFVNDMPNEAVAQFQLAVDHGDEDAEGTMRQMRAAVGGDPLGAYFMGGMADSLHQGEVALRWHAQAARAGLPHALGSYTWQLLLEGDHARAIELFDETIDSCRRWADNAMDNDASSNAAYEIANARCNDAMNRLALGGDPARAQRVWSEGQQTGHEESHVFPAILAHREGRTSEAKALVAALDDGYRSQAPDMLRRFASSSVGWFKDWCESGLELFEEVV